MKLFVLIIFLINVAFLNAELIDDLRLAADARNDETLILFHYNLAMCVKYDIEPNDILFNLKKNTNLKNIKVIATVICDRDIELKIFKKDKSWKYSMFRNDGTLLSKLDAAPDIFITVIKPDNKKLHLNRGNAEKNYSKIIDFIYK